MKLSKLHKKAQVQTLAPAILSLVFAAIVLVFGLVMLQELRDTDAITGGAASNNETAYIAANDTLIGLATFADFWEIIVLAVVITIVIGLLLIVFGGATRR